MGIMQAPRVRHPQPARQRPHQPATPEPEASRELVPPPPDAYGDHVNPRLWELFQTLDLGELFRIEFIEGAIVVRGVPSLWHERVIAWIRDELAKSCRAHGWVETGASGMQLPPPCRGVRPDLLVIRDPDTLPQDEGEIPATHVLLAGEVASPDSKRHDRELKSLSYARAGIQVYLLVDRFAEPPSFSVLSDPGDDGYRGKATVPFGTGAGKLHVPEPFGITLDLTTVPVP